MKYSKDRLLSLNKRQTIGTDKLTAVLNLFDLMKTDVGHAINITEPTRSLGEDELVSAEARSNLSVVEFPESSDDFLCDVLTSINAIDLLDVNKDDFDIEPALSLE